MESIIKKIDKIKFKTRNWFVVAPLIAFVILLLGSAFIAVMYWISGESVSENFAETTRNFAWLFLMWLSPTGVIIGLWLTWWRMRLAQESHDRERLENLQERFKKATDMLNSNIEWERVGACLVLADLGKADESMKRRCVRLLFAFINDPPFTGHPESRNLDELFSHEAFFRSDIQEAIVSFSVIYEHYGNEGIDDEAVRLPSYFWRNESKGKISLVKANLRRESLDEVELSRANLRGANLENASICGANLQFADLQKADLSFAAMMNTNLYKANLQRAKLKRTILEEAELPFAILRRANLQNANLIGASLQEADLQNTNLNGTNLQDANLEGANLQNADISGANMEGAKNLTKEQILSAKWVHGRHPSGPPQLPLGYDQDEDIKKWLERPSYSKVLTITVRGKSNEH